MLTGYSELPYLQILTLHVGHSPFIKNPTHKLVNIQNIRTQIFANDSQTILVLTKYSTDGCLQLQKMMPSINRATKSDFYVFPSPYSAEPYILIVFKNSNTCVTLHIVSTWNGFGKIIILNFIKLYFSSVVG